MIVWQSDIYSKATTKMDTADYVGFMEVNFRYRLESNQLPVCREYGNITMMDMVIEYLSCIVYS